MEVSRLEDAIEDFLSEGIGHRTDADAGHDVLGHQSTIPGDGWKKADDAYNAQLAVFPETPAAPSGNITPDAAIEGLSIDEKLKIQQEKSAPKNPGLQSAGFDPKA